MFLDLKQRILPGSIGPGISKKGTDGTPLRPGIKNANDQQATVVWCHNQFGFEDLPSWISGLVQAQNIFDGGNKGNYEETFYRYLNLGIRAPFSTGTDWFIYDFSRVYTEIGEGKTSVASWLKNFRQGQTFITNGPLLELTVNGASPGANIKTGKKVTVQYRAMSRENFGELELVKNGKATLLSPTRKNHNGWHEYTGELEVPVNGPSWIAVRVSPNANVKNEFGRKLFGHTSPVYINHTKGDIIDPDVVDELITEIESDLAAIRERGSFDSPEDIESVATIYKDAIQKLRAMQTP